MLYFCFFNDTVFDVRKCLIGFHHADGFSVLDNERIFNTDAEFASFVNARFVGKYHIFGKNRGGRGADGGAFVNMHANAVTQRVGK